MICRSFAGFALATWALLSLVPAVMAGGWAVTTFDALPSDVRAGESYRLGYTIRQHGTTPFLTDDTHVRIRSAATGESHSFTGRSDGAPGHYVVEVRFPAAGEWTWEVKPGPFQAQQLGTVGVLPAGGAGTTEDQAAGAPATGAAVEQSGLAAGWRLALPLLTGVALALFAAQVVVYARGRPRAQRVAQPARQ